MKNVSPFLFALLCFCAILGSCKKNKPTTPSNEPVFLRDKSLPEIKAAVQGHWKIHYKYGGITGNIKTPLIDSYFDVLPNDSVYLSYNNIPAAAGIGTYQRVTTSFGYSAVTINFSQFGGFSYSWIVDQKLGDTLVLDDNFINGEARLMTKVP